MQSALQQKIYFALRIISTIRISLGPVVGRYPIKFILPECVSYLGDRGVLCVGNG